MQKPESRFSDYLHSKLSYSVYYEKMNNSYRGGIPDFYYEGKKDILWAEHKWIEKPWTKNLEPNKVCSTVSWVRQRYWLERAYANQKQTCVIVGIGKGKDTFAYILEFPYSFDLEKNIVLPINKVVEYIFLKTNETKLPNC